MAYRFTPLREEDFGTVRRWLLEPHVKRWWDDGVKTPYPDAVIADYRDAIEGKDPTYHYLAHVDGRPVGMLQTSIVSDVSAFNDQRNTGFGVSLRQRKSTSGVNTVASKPRMFS